MGCVRRWFILLKRFSVKVIVFINFVFCVWFVRRIWIVLLWLCMVRRFIVSFVMVRSMGLKVMVMGRV